MLVIITPIAVLVLVSSNPNYRVYVDQLLPQPQSWWWSVVTLTVELMLIICYPNHIIDIDHYYPNHEVDADQFLPQPQSWC